LQKHSSDELAPFLLDEFHRLSDAPGSAQRWRELIRDLAVRGRLAVQSQDDKSLTLAGPAPALQSTTHATTPPFPVPVRWRWERLGNLCELVRGVTFTSSDKGQHPSPSRIACLRSGNVQESVDWDNLLYIPRSVVKKRVQLLQPGDILISIANSYALVGKCAIVDTAFRGEATFGAFLAVIRPRELDPRYLRLYLSCSFSAETFRAKSAQTTNIANITFGTIRNHQVPVPSLSEQRRIVAKVDELISMCDDLAGAQEAREKARNAMAAATLSEVASLSAGDPVDSDLLRQRAHFFVRNADRLATRPEDLEGIRKTVLDLALQGRLTPQDPLDEPASVLLERIYRGRLGSAARSSPLPNSSGEPEEHFVPGGWAVTKLGDVIALVSGQHLQPGEYSNDSQSGPPYITGPADFGDGGLVITRYALARKAMAKKGQILLTVKGAGVGKTAVCDLPEVAISRQLMAMSALGWSNDFLLLVTHQLASVLRSNARSLIPGISRVNVSEFTFALPPLAEQSRIVAKVSELMRLCHQLETNLRSLASRRSRFLEAAVVDCLEGYGDDGTRPTVLPA
jgi:type I restriction enzyme, S subunit